MRRAAGALAVLLFVVLATWTAWASCCPPGTAGSTNDCCKPSASPAASPAARADVFPGEAHGYVLRLPAGWVFQPRNGPDDAAEVRFTNGAMLGSYQIFEGAVTDDPRAWYAETKQRYEDRAGSIPAIRSIEVGPLQDATLGGAPAHQIGMDTTLRDGPVVTTRIIFAMRANGQRLDVHELIVSGEKPSFRLADVEKLSQGVEWTR